jgi:hypothetical protein
VIGDFQRWLLRAGARGMSRELADQVRTALGKNQQTGDVWETATTEPLPGEAPECAWCPLCRAARLVREARPTRDTRVAAVGDALTTVVQDAVSVLEAALAATNRGGGAPNGRGADTGPGTRGFPAAGSAAAQAPSGGPAAAQEPSAAPAAAQEPSGGPAAQEPSAAPAAQAPSASATAAQTAPEDPGAPASPAGQAEPGAGEPAAATGEQAAPELGEESPHEPDDRG